MRPSGETVTFRTRHVRQLREMAKRRGLSMNAMLSGVVEEMVLRSHKKELRDIRDRAMNAASDLAWAEFGTPERDAAIDRLKAALSDFEDALDKAGL